MLMNSVNITNNIYITLVNGRAVINVSAITANANITCNTNIQFSLMKSCDCEKYGHAYYNNVTGNITYILDNENFYGTDCYEYCIKCGGVSDCGIVYVTIEPTNGICATNCTSELDFKFVDYPRIECDIDFDITCNGDEITFSGIGLISGGTWEFYDFVTSGFSDPSIAINSGLTYTFNINDIAEDFFNTLYSNCIRVKFVATSICGDLQIVKDIDFDTCETFPQDTYHSNGNIIDCSQNCIVFGDTSILNDEIISGPRWYLSDGSGSNFVQISDEATATVCCNPFNRVCFNIDYEVSGKTFCTTINPCDIINGELLSETNYYKYRYNDEYIQLTGGSYTVCQLCDGCCNDFELLCTYNDLSKKITLNFYGTCYSGNTFEWEIISGNTNVMEIDNDLDVLVLEGDALTIKDTLLKITYIVNDPICNNSNYDVIKLINFNTEEDCLTRCEDVVITPITSAICETYLTGVIYFKRVIETNCGTLWTEKVFTYNQDINWCDENTDICNCDENNLIDDFLNDISTDPCRNKLEPPKCNNLNDIGESVNYTLNNNLQCGDKNYTKLLKLEYELINCGKICLTKNIAHYFNLTDCNPYICLSSGETFNNVKTILGGTSEDEDLTSCSGSVINLTCFDGLAPDGNGEQKVFMNVSWSADTAFDTYELNYVKFGEQFTIDYPTILDVPDYAWNVVDNISGFNYTILTEYGFASCVSFYLRVRGICDDGYSDWSLPIICNTHCVITGGDDDLDIPVSSITYNENNGLYNFSWETIEAVELPGGYYEVTVGAPLCAIPLQTIIISDGAASLSNWFLFDGCINEFNVRAVHPNGTMGAWASILIDLT